MIAAMIIIRENSDGCLGNVWIKSDFYALAVPHNNMKPVSPNIFSPLSWSKLKTENQMDIQVFIKIISHKHTNGKSPQSTN